MTAVTPQSNNQQHCGGAAPALAEDALGASERDDRLNAQEIEHAGSSSNSQLLAAICRDWLGLPYAGQRPRAPMPEAPPVTIAMRSWKSVTICLGPFPGPSRGPCALPQAVPQSVSRSRDRSDDSTACPPGRAAGIPWP